MSEENPTRGAPKVHGEILRLGFVVSERTVARYLRHVRRHGNPTKRSPTFLQNHRKVIVALDFFTVLILPFRLLYCFFVIEHGRRRILHFNVTRHPTAEWVVQQLRETFPEAGPYRYMILGRDSKFDADVITFLKVTGLKATRTSVQSPWQNGVAKRWVLGGRKELLDFVIPLNEEHLRRLVRKYICYFHKDRIHDGLDKGTPNGSLVEKKPCPEATVVSGASLGASIIATPGAKEGRTLAQAAIRSASTINGPSAESIARRTDGLSGETTDPKVQTQCSPRVSADISTRPAVGTEKLGDANQSREPSNRRSKVCLPAQIRF